MSTPTTPTTAAGPAAVDDTFHDRLNELTAQAAGQAAAAAAAAGGALRPWNRPGGAWSGDPLDVPGTVGPFDRTALGTAYAAGLADGTKPATVGDAIAIKVQGDYLAVAERGYRARHASPVRLLAMAAARRAGHGHPRGVLAGGVLGYVQGAIRNGRA